MRPIHHKMRYLTGYNTEMIAMVGGGSARSPVSCPHDITAYLLNYATIRASWNDDHSAGIY